GTPDAEVTLRRAAGQKTRQNDLAELLERLAVAEEERLVRHQRVGEVAQQRRIAVLSQRGRQRVEAVQVVLARHRRQAAFDQVRLVAAEDEPRTVEDQLAEKGKIVGLHTRPPVASFATWPAICDTGRMALQIPAVAAAPGMPQTTLVASSCATTVPPAFTTISPPLAPSEPMPVRMTHSTPAPYASLRLRNIGSTAGRQKFSGGSLSRRITFAPPRTSTLMWKSPGAM